MRTIIAMSVVLFILTGTIAAQDTVQVKTGWNIIGAVKPGAVPDVLSTDPPGLITTAFFGYDPGAGYGTSDTLKKGLGYWVKAGADGIIIFNTSSSAECGVKRVDYGGISYGTVKIGTQCWLNENLNVGTMITGVTDQTNDGILEKYCYDDDPVNCGLYGGLFRWNEAMQYGTDPGAQGICPAGWHIPTYGEFLTLSSTVGDDGNALKKGGVGTGGGAGTNTSGFSALLAGYSDDEGFFGNLDVATSIWSSTEDSGTLAVNLFLYYLDSDVYVVANNGFKTDGRTVRCLED